MPYDLLEKQIKMLPETYYNELVHYVEFLLKKSEEKQTVDEEKSLERIRDCGVADVWEYLKNDTW